MKKLLLPIILLILVLTGAGFYFLVKGEEVLENMIPDEPQYDIDTHIVTEDDIFATIVEGWDIGYSQMLELLEMTSSTYDLTMIRIGQPLRLARDEAGDIVWLEYEMSREEYVHVDFVSDGYEAEMRDITYEVEIIKQSGTVSSSMYIDALDAGIPDTIIMQFADAFAWTIDFSVEVQKGDTFALVYERRYRDGEEAGTGDVITGEFVNKGEVHRGYLFENEEGNPAYYSQDGEAMIKQFLKAPLNYRRITSGYTYGRFHPVLQQNYNHLAIDYAAAIGTPVMSVGDGVIRTASWNGGFGNYIDVRHNDVYATQYAHLSSYARGIRPGVKVVQGQVIGYVGSTGWSTGPHLHYQIKKYGSLVNPLTLELPPGDPVPEDMREDFERVKSELDKWY